MKGCPLAKFTVDSGGEGEGDEADAGGGELSGGRGSEHEGRWAGDKEQGEVREGTLSLALREVKVGDHHVPGRGRGDLTFLVSKFPWCWALILQRGPSSEGVHHS